MKTKLDKELFYKSYHQIQSLESLTPSEKDVIFYILSLQTQGLVCYASNGRIATSLGLAVVTIKRITTRLVKLGIMHVIEVTTNNYGSGHILRINMDSLQSLIKESSTTLSDKTLQSTTVMKPSGQAITVHSGAVTQRNIDEEKGITNDQLVGIDGSTESDDSPLFEDNNFGEDEYSIGKETMRKPVRPEINSQSKLMYESFTRELNLKLTRRQSEDMFECMTECDMDINPETIQDAYHRIFGDTTLDCG